MIPPDFYMQLLAGGMGSMAPGLSPALGVGGYAGMGAMAPVPQGPQPMGPPPAMGNQYPQDPFLDEDWSPNKKDAYRDLALNAGLALLQGRPGDWGAVSNAIGQGWQGYKANIEGQEAKAQKRREVEFGLGEMTREREAKTAKAMREEAAKRKEAWEEATTRKQRLEEQRKKVETLLPQERELLAPFVGEKNFEENYVRILRERQKREADEAKAAKKAASAAAKGKTPAAAPKADYLEMLNDEVRRRIDALPAKLRGADTRAKVVEQVRSEFERAGIDFSFLDPEPKAEAAETGGVNPNVIAMLRTRILAIPPNKRPDLTAAARRVEDVLAKTEPGKRSAVLMAMLAELDSLGRGGTENLVGDPSALPPIVPLGPAPNPSPAPVPLGTAQPFDLSHLTRTNQPMDLSYLLGGG